MPLFVFQKKTVASLWHYEIYGGKYYMKAYSFRQMQDAGIRVDDYKANEREGVFIARLDVKRWGKGKNILRSLVLFKFGLKQKLKHRFSLLSSRHRIHSFLQKDKNSLLYYYKIFYQESQRKNEYFSKKVNIFHFPQHFRKYFKKTIEKKRIFRYNNCDYIFSKGGDRYVE